MFKDDRSYYQHRAEVEAKRAQRAKLPSVVQAHRQLAEAYREKLSSAESIKVEAL
jgi:hypothetical protein